ncbi:hypothetical protein ACFQX6_09680 [Streptosporangium lutulentum]
MVHYTTLWSVLLPAVAVAFLSVPVVGAAMVRSDRRNAVGWILVAAGVGLPLACTGYLLAEAAYVGGADIPGAEWAGWWDGWPWVFAVGLVPTVGLLLFPDGRLPSPRWRPVLWVCVVQMTALLLGLLFSPALLDFPDQANPTALPGVWGSVAEGLGGAVALTAPLSTLAAWSVRRRLSRTREADQARALALVAPAAWLIAASWWGCLVIAVWGEATITALPAEVFGMLALAVTSWVAIRRYGLFDGRQVLNRTLVYGLLTTLVIAVYLAVAAAVRVLASDAVSGAVAVAAAVLIALPLRDVLQRTANRLVYGYRDDPYGALVRLGRRLEAAAAADQVLPGVARTVREALRLPYVAVRVGVATVAEAAARRAARARSSRSCSRARRSVSWSHRCVTRAPSRCRSAGCSPGSPVRSPRPGTPCRSPKTCCARANASWARRRRNGGDCAVTCTTGLARRWREWSWDSTAHGATCSPTPPRPPGRWTR